MISLLPVIRGETGLNPPPKKAVKHIAFQPVVNLLFKTPGPQKKKKKRGKNAEVFLCLLLFTVSNVAQ